MLDLSVIIVSWNTRDLLDRCLRQLYRAAAGLAIEVFVVDNASHDGSQELVRERYPQAMLLANDTNLGFVRANNQALPQAGGEFVLLLNSDAFLDPDALQMLVDFMRAHPRAGAAGPRLRYPDGALQRSCTAFPTLWHELCLMLQLDRLFPSSPIFASYWYAGWQYDTVREVDSIMGACLLVRNTAMQQIGILDEDYVMYSEEVDWCYRIQQAGWQNYLVPAATAEHIWGGSTGPVRVEAFVQFFRSRLTFFRKHRGLLATGILKGIFGFGGAVRVVAGLPLLVLARLRKRQAHPKLICYWRLLGALPGL
jgi:hypothetical protein